MCPLRGQSLESRLAAQASVGRAMGLAMNGKKPVGLGDIKPGLILHLDPDTFEKEGATYTCAPQLRVRGGHFFLCISSSKDLSQWLPLYSEQGVGRKEIPRKGRTGDSKWTTASCFWHKDQVWTASGKAALAAAIAGGDMSTGLSLNRLAKTQIPAVQ